MPTESRYYLNRLMDYALNSTPNHAALSLDALEDERHTTSEAVKDRHLMRSLIHSNHALIAALTETRRGNDWAGMDGNEK